MEKETIKVHDTRVTGISRQEAGALVTIALKGISFQPGQFLMVKTCDGEVRWGYPYLIEEAGPESVTVLALARSDLYRQLPDSEVAVWGPRGRGPLADGDGTVILVAQPATVDRILPFLRSTSHRCRLLLMVGENPQGNCQLFNEQISTVCINGVEPLCVALEGMDDSQIIAALNPREMLEFRNFAPREIQQKAWMFMPTKIGCGIGACVGCVVHSSEAPFGIKICEEGPFLRLDRVDLEADIHSFVTRV